MNPIRTSFFVALLLIMGCAGLNSGELATIPQSGIISTHEELRAARAYWKSTGIDDYAFTFTRSCFCPPGWRGPFEVIVRNDAVARAFREQRAIQAEELEDLGIPTMNDLYALTDTAYVEGAALIEIEVDPESGAIRNLFIDRDERIADEEIGVAVTNYRPR